MVKEMRAAFYEVHPGGFWEKLHGGQFQTGLPDILVALERAAALVEAKWLRDEVKANMSVPKCASVLLSEMQAHKLSYLAALDCPLRARILIGFEVETDALPHGRGEFALGFDLADADALKNWSPAELASVWLNAKLEGGWPDGLPVKMQAQLRGHGEEWRAAPLALGMRYDTHYGLDDGR